MFKYYYFLQISTYMLGRGMVLDGVIEGSLEELCEKVCGSFENKKVLRIILSKILVIVCLLYTSPSPRDRQKSRMPSSA